MTERKYPKNCRTPYGTEPMTEADWDRYFECRKTLDNPMSIDDIVQLIIDHKDEFLGDDGTAKKKYNIPLRPNIALAMKLDLGIKYLIEYNLYEAKKMYPDEF